MHGRTRVASAEVVNFLLNESSQVKEFIRPKKNQAADCRKHGKGSDVIRCKHPALSMRPNYLSVNCRAQKKGRPLHLGESARRNGGYLCATVTFGFARYPDTESLVI